MNKAVKWTFTFVSCRPTQAVALGSVIFALLTGHFIFAILFMITAIMNVGDREKALQKFLRARFSRNPARA